VAAADYLVSTGYVAWSKIAVLGGSYGGYLTLRPSRSHPSAGRPGWTCTASVPS